MSIHYTNVLIKSVSKFKNQIFRLYLIYWLNRWIQLYIFILVLTAISRLLDEPMWLSQIGKINPPNSHNLHTSGSYFPEERLLFFLEKPFQMNAYVSMTRSRWRALLVRWWFDPCKIFKQAHNAFIQHTNGYPGFCKTFLFNGTKKKKK